MQMSREKNILHLTFIDQLRPRLFGTRFHFKWFSVPTFASRRSRTLRGKVLETFEKKIKIKKKETKKY